MKQLHFGSLWHGNAPRLSLASSTALGLGDGFHLRGRDDGDAVSLPECAEHVQQFGGESPLPNLMEVKG